MAALWGKLGAWCEEEGKRHTRLAQETRSEGSEGGSSVRSKRKRSSSSSKAGQPRLPKDVWSPQEMKRFRAALDKYGAREDLISKSREEVRAKLEVLVRVGLKEAVVVEELKPKPRFIDRERTNVADHFLRFSTLPSSSPSK
ncbi:hypothetical protein QOT17_017374 [Balamuthia mandrillaris]